MSADKHEKKVTCEVYCLQGAGIDEDSSDTSNIETFSFVLHLLPELTSIFQSTNAEH